VLPRAGRYEVLYTVYEGAHERRGRAVEELVVDTQTQVELRLPQVLVDVLEAERSRKSK
jgi:hypothetical protein